MVLLWRVLSSLFLCLLAFGCSSRTAGTHCQPACEGGSVCVHGVCERLCSLDTDCDAQCCADGICVECPLSSPEITSVNGTGAEDGDPATSTHRIVDRLVIEGKGFTGATVKLSQGGSEEELELCASAPQQLVALLPAGLAAGDYTLTVANQAGACSTAISLLRGEKGDKGDKGEPGSYTIQDSADSGLILAGDALSVDPQFILDVVEEAKPELHALYVAHHEFMPERDTWLRAGYGTWRNSHDASKVARAPLRLPDGAIIEAVQCRAKGGSSTDQLSIRLERLSRSADALAAHTCNAHTWSSTTGVASVPLCSPNIAVDGDLESTNYRTYALRADTEAGGINAMIYGCRVAYSLP